MRAAATCEASSSGIGVVRHDLWNWARRVESSAQLRDALAWHGSECTTALAAEKADLAEDGRFGQLQLHFKPYARAVARAGRQITGLRQAFTAATKSRSYVLEALGEGHPPGPGYHRRQEALNPLAALLLKLLSFSRISTCSHCARSSRISEHQGEHSPELAWLHLVLHTSFGQLSRTMSLRRGGLAKFEDARPRSVWRTKRLTCPPRCSAFS